MQTRTLSAALTRAFRPSAAVLLFACGAAFAADPPPKESSIGKAAAGSPLLTREQLRSCIAQGAKVNQGRDEVTKEQAALELLKAEIDQRAEALKAKASTVDRSKADAIEAYNQEIAERQKLNDAYQLRADAANAKVDVVNADTQAYVKDCNNRRYLDADAAALQQGK